MEPKRSFTDKVIYQIYPRSFCDSNGDGIGDIEGIISKLDYLKDLGIDCLWLSPIYKSPLMDMGYDVADYYSIHPDYGTMEDFDRLLEEADKRGLKIIMDLVVNHTSDQHEWFKASRDPASPYRDYYIWRKGKKEGVPPNNWTSMFTGPAWTYDRESGEWYLHLYSAEQPDLNFHNEQVVEEVERILRFYLDKGVYGFRCDVINQCYKESLKDGKGLSPSGRGMEHYLCSEGNHRLLRRFYDDVFSHYDCVVIGETYAIDVENGKRYLDNHELDMFFQFDTANCDNLLVPVFKKKFRPRYLRDALYKWQTGVSWMANYLENHDQPRSINHYGDPVRFPKASGKALAVLNLTLRGTPFIYQGEEIGMTNLPLQDPEQSQDVSCRLVNGILKKLPLAKKTRYKLANRVNRDHARSPMQWSDAPSAGFSRSEKTWLPVNPNYKAVNVASEANEPSSILNFYKTLLKLRKDDETFVLGDFRPIMVHGDLIAYQRVYKDKRRFVLINLTGKDVNIPRHLILDGAKLLLSSLPVQGYRMGFLSPFEADIFEINGFIMTNSDKR